MTKFEEELKETYEKVSINLYGNNAGSIGMKKLLNELKDTGLLKEQQALPVVPECVGKELYNIDFNYWIENKMTLACFTARTLNWLEQHRGDWNIEYYICKLRFGGFKVEKPQLFYLKNKLTRQYLYRRDKVSFGEQDYCKDSDDKPLAYCLFTKEEIDSMQTGSYEQIKVEVEK